MEESKKETYATEFASSPTGGKEVSKVMLKGDLNEIAQMIAEREDVYFYSTDRWGVPITIIRGKIPAKNTLPASTTVAEYVELLESKNPTKMELVRELNGLVYKAIEADKQAHELVGKATDAIIDFARKLIEPS